VLDIIIARISNKELTKNYVTYPAVLRIFYVLALLATIEFLENSTQPYYVLVSKTY
jgi:hypothetical protein